MSYYDYIDASELFFHAVKSLQVKKADEEFTYDIIDDEEESPCFGYKDVMDRLGIDLV